MPGQTFQFRLNPAPKRGAFPFPMHLDCRIVDLSPQLNPGSTLFTGLRMIPCVRWQLGRSERFVQVLTLKTHCGASSMRCNSLLASNSHDFEVPSGISRMDAISECFIPSTSKSRKTVR